MNFNKYSNLYDLLNSNKNYKSETEYFLSFLDKKENINALEIGSGTGGHAQFIEKKTNLTCVEKSPEMAKLASKKIKSKIIVGDIKDINFEEKKFDVCFCLFHVINYLNENKDLSNFFEKISNCLVDGGKFIFDFWHTPAVYKIGSTSRKRVFEKDNLLIERLSTPSFLPIKNIIEVDFEFKITDKTSNIILDNYNEKHSMRPFSIPELEILSEQFNFHPITYYNNLTNEPPTLENWDVCAILNKN